MQDVVQLVSGKAEEVELPEKADILVSEWMVNRRSKTEQSQEKVGLFSCLSMLTICTISNWQT